MHVACVVHLILYGQKDCLLRVSPALAFFFPRIEAGGRRRRHGKYLKEASFKLDTRAFRVWPLSNFGSDKPGPGERGHCGRLGPIEDARDLLRAHLVNRLRGKERDSSTLKML